MIVGVSFSERLLPLLCTAAFLAAGGATPYGQHGCSHHDGPRGPEHEHRTVAGDGLGSHEHGTTPSGTADHGPDDPCTCVGTCHVSAHAPVPGAGPAASSATAAVQASSAILAARHLPKGPRHHLFELHLPNAPPRPV